MAEQGPGPGSLVAGRYRLGERIGSGAMGVVWQATDERLQRTVALKHVYTSHGLTAEERETSNARVLREGRIAARVHHPCAITVHDVVEHEGDPWLVQEYLPSRSLADWLREHGPLPPEHAATAGASVAGALAVAHAAGVVHRDVKPANILLAEDGSVKITDFGISRASGDLTLTSTGLIAGTPAYLAPEMARGEPPAPTCDVFSLGSTLYAAVEGHPPFTVHDNPIALLHVVAAGDFAPPQQAGPLTALLLRMMRAAPAERPSMTQVAAALQHIRHGRPVAPESLAPAEQEAVQPNQPQNRFTPPSAQGQPAQVPRAAPVAVAAGHMTPTGGALPPTRTPPQTAQPRSAKPEQPGPGLDPRTAPGTQPGAPDRRTPPQPGPDPTRQAPLPATGTHSARVNVRGIALATFAVLLAVAVGIGISSLLMSLTG